MSAEFRYGPAAAHRDPEYVSAMEHFESMTHAGIHDGTEKIDAGEILHASLTWLEAAAALTGSMPSTRSHAEQTIDDAGWRGPAAEAAAVSARSFAASVDELAAVFTEVGARLGAVSGAAEAVKLAVPPPGHTGPVGAIARALEAAHVLDAAIAEEVMRQEAILTMNMIYKPAYSAAGSGVPALPAVPDNPAASPAPSAPQAPGDRPQAVEPPSAPPQSGVAPSAPPAPPAANTPTPGPTAPPPNGSPPSTPAPTPESHAPAPAPHQRCLTVHTGAAPRDARPRAGPESKPASSSSPRDTHPGSSSEPIPHSPSASRPTRRTTTRGTTAVRPGRSAGHYRPDPRYQCAHSGPTGSVPTSLIRAITLGPGYTRTRSSA